MVEIAVVTSVLFGGFNNLSFNKVCILLLIIKGCFFK
jgi:hypothetical protein